jgi:hypothetical protein
MWSDEIDKKIRDTMESRSEPAFDEKSWEKMAALLDTHLPEEKRKRRPILFWLLPLALAGSALFFYSKISKNPDLPSVPKITPPSSTLPGNNLSSDKKSQVREIQPTTRERASTPIASGISSEQTGIGDLNNEIAETNSPHDAARNGRSKNLPGIENAAGNVRVKTKKDLPLNGANIKDRGNQSSENITAEVPATITGKNQNSKRLTPVIAGDRPVNAVAGENAKAIKTETTNPEENKLLTPPDSSIAIAKQLPKKGKAPMSSRIALLVSAGPDISGVSFGRLGKWELQYGLGISVELSKKFSVRSGFYTGQKVYTADSADYHSDYLPPKLEKIDANCRVYEIPLNLVYNISESKHHIWFVSAGFSSYIMKRETYDYYYKNSWGQTQVYKHTYRNENKHLFSVIGLSAGYQFKLNERFSILTEPYARVPLGGVGQGKVKLRNAGVLFTASFKPFLKSR